jgi:hypothetical protein
MMILALSRKGQEQFMGTMPVDADDSGNSDDLTGINTLNGEHGTLNVFDLQGRRVMNPTKGLYIVNNKLVVKHQSH